MNEKKSVAIQKVKSKRTLPVNGIPIFDDQGEVKYVVGSERDVTELNLLKEWLDAYGHLNEAYYLLPFSNTTSIIQDHFGIGVDYFDGTICATAELMVLHYHTEQGRTVPMPDAVQAMLKNAEGKQKPDWVGHSISLNKH